MNIPFVSENGDFDCCSRMYRRAIWNTLLELKPKYSLEIGTFTYQSSHVFSKYYREYNEKGLLITADISTWNRGEAPPNVYPVMVYPHEDDMEKYHGNIDLYYDNYRDILLSDEGTAEINCTLIKREMALQGVDGLFGLTFVDATHTRASFLKDLVIAKELTEPEGFILIDDINDWGNEQANVYQELRERNSFYEFEDWKNSPGMALIKNKEFQL